MRRSLLIIAFVGALACGGPSTVIRENESTFTPNAIAAGGGFVYWVDSLNGNVGRVGVDGSNKTVLATGQKKPSSITVDATNVYWTNSGDDALNNCGATPRCFTSNGGVFEMPLAGGTPIALASNLCGADSIAVDASNVYVGVSGNGSVLEIPIAGGTPLIHTVAEIGLGAVAVDAHDVYWTSLSADWMHVTVSKSPIGAPSPTVITEPLGAIPGSSGCGTSAAILAVDAQNVFWSIWDLTQSPSSTPLTLMKMPVGGGPATPLAVMAREDEDEDHGDFAIDATNAYWYDTTRQRLRTVPLSGGEVTDVSSVYAQPSALAMSGRNLFCAEMYQGRIEEIGVQ
jgi:hypothetical protein